MDVSDNNATVIGIYVDLQKTFDTVHHNILLHKNRLIN